jgi:hypothetical protein
MLTNDTVTNERNRDAAVQCFRGRALRILAAVNLLLAILMLGACGGSSSSTLPPINVSASGNWQFTMAPPHDGSFTGGLLGGFLLETSGSVTGGTTYAVSLPGFLIPCNSGSATITGTVSGQTVSLTAVAGTQTFALKGTISLDGSSMSGTYNSTDGTASNGAPCGTAQSGLQWFAALVPPLTGPVQGTFHSAGGAAGLNEQDFVVTGALTQAANTGASSEAVTGNLSFIYPHTNQSDYPCISSAYVYGEISGNAVNFQLVGSDESILGEIGEPLGANGATGINPVTYASVNSVYILNGLGPSYMVATSSCPGSLGNITTAGDYGTICLALGGATACQQPLTLSPSALMFEPLAVGATPTTETITVADTANVNLGSLTLQLANNSGANNFTESDTCGVDGVPSQGQPFSLNSGQSCEITITFAPLQVCTEGNQDQCLTATLTAINPTNDQIVLLPITGTGTSGGAVAGISARITTMENHASVGALQNWEHHAGN